MINTRKVKISIQVILIIVLSQLIFSNKSIQSISWTYPYFSGAANFEKFGKWEISPTDYLTAQNLNFTEYRKYKHRKTGDLVTNTVNNYGYVLIALTSMTIFPFLGDIEGVIVFQLFTHILASLYLILFVLKKNWHRTGFILFYSANPLVIHFVTFPFYYYWMFIPSFIIITLIIKREWLSYVTILAVPLLLISFWIRPTTLFLVMMYFVVAISYAYTKYQKAIVYASTALLVIGLSLLTSNSSGSPWHTIYIGIGAYDNNYGVNSLSDNNGYEYFHSITGVTIDTNPVVGNWNDTSLRDTYSNVLKERFFEIASQNPIMLIRNALYNTLQVFSIGYIVNQQMLTFISATVGLLVIGFLTYSKQYIWILAILSSAIGFCLYFPPIPAYNFAAYPLIVVGIILGLDSNNHLQKLLNIINLKR